MNVFDFIGVKNEQARKAPTQTKVIRKVKQDKTKILLRWLYWIILSSVVLLVLAVSLEAGYIMYKELR